MTTGRLCSVRLSPLLGLLALGICGASSTVARSAEAAASSADAAAAQALFDESKKLLATGQFAAARPKLEESERLDASPSTEFYLADCYQHLGQTASAWALFLQVASESKAAGRVEREQFARKRASDLAPKLSHLLLSVPTGPGSAGLEVKRDGETVGMGQRGTAVPVNPGKHTVSATQPNHVAWSQTVDVPAGKTVSLDVPPLALAPVEPVAAISPPPVAPPPPPASLVHAPASAPSPAPAGPDGQGGSTRRTIALVAGGVGVIAIGMGGVFGGLAISKNNESKTGGCDGNECNAVGFSTRRTAESDATISSVLIGAGAAAVVGGVVLWLTAPSSTYANQGAGAGHAGLALRLAPNGVFLNGVFE